MRHRRLVTVPDVTLLRDAVAAAKDVDGRLAQAHEDQLGRTVRMLNLATLAVAGQLAAITLLVQIGFDIPAPLEGALGLSLALTLLALGILVAAQVNLPNDALWSWGSLPWVYARRAAKSKGNEAIWLASTLDDLDERVRHNAAVMVVLIRRRHFAVVTGAAGMLLFLASMAFIAGGASLA